MKLRSVYKLATVLTKSQIRGYRRRKLLIRVFGDPRTIILLDLVLVGGLGALSYFMASRVFAIGTQSALKQVEAEGLAAIPTAMAFAVILLGTLSEMSQPIQSTSTDLVNWLPVSPAEYVAASALSLSYTYSFLISMFLGISLGLAIFFNAISVWATTAAMSIVALAMGACTVEIMRALTNKISSSFYRKSGRSGILIRLFLTIVVLVFFQLLFSGPIVSYLLRELAQTIKVAWFVPVVWPSLTVLGVTDGNMLSAVGFGTLSFMSVTALFALAVVFRALYWVPIPVSIRLSTQAYSPNAKSGEWFGLSSAESAVVRKDWRSLIRRREMARFLAIPFVLAISMSVSFLPMGRGTIPEDSSFFTLLPLFILPVAIFCSIFSMTSIGQEGYAVWHLYMAPLSARQLVKAKLLLALLLGLAFNVGMLIVLSLLVKTAALNFLLLLALGSVIVFEESLVGIYFSARFPDFREAIRTRFVTFWGSLIGVFLSLILAALTATPILLSIIAFRTLIAQMVTISLIIGAVVSIVSWRLAEHQVKALMRSIQI